MILPYIHKSKYYDMKHAFVFPSPIHPYLKNQREVLYIFTTSVWFSILKWINFYMRELLKMLLLKTIRNLASPTMSFWKGAITIISINDIPAQEDIPFVLFFHECRCLSEIKLSIHIQKTFMLFVRPKNIIGSYKTR